MPPEPIRVGHQAPDFELPDQHGQPVRLSDYRGKKNVVVVFYPLTFTRVCQAEMCALRDDLPSFHNEHTQLLAVSCEPSPTHRRWAEEQSYGFPLLADFWPHGQAARAYGVFDERLGVALRGTFILDRDGIVRYTAVNAMSDARDQQEYEKVLAELA